MNSRALGIDYTGLIGSPSFATTMDQDESARRSGADGVYPLGFASSRADAASRIYLDDPLIAKLVSFFEAKGLAALKEEDRCETWYADWLDYQRAHRLYASLLTPRAYATADGGFDLLRMARFLEVFAYHSPSHGYSLQVTFLGFFSILMGDNAALKQEAVATLNAGEVMAFAVSEKDHGADLLGNAFTIQPTSGGMFRCEGSKYYIGNANVAALIPILARRVEPTPAQSSARRMPLALIALRPKQTPAFQNVQKIRTLGIRAAFVGSFDVKAHELPQSDIIAEGRTAWEAVVGTVTVGKFLLGFGSIGICERAFEEAVGHLSRRILFGKPAIELPNIRLAMTQAYVRLAAMKLYAYRALDYLHAASASERRYLLFNAVQKAKVGVDGVKVMALISECVGARGFECDTYIEMALRDAALIPSVEGSTHINLLQASQFIPRYFAGAESLVSPPSVTLGECASAENAYLMSAGSGGIGNIAFAHCRDAYAPFQRINNVRLFAAQVETFARWLGQAGRDAAAAETAIARGRILAVVAFGQLVAEHADRAKTDPMLVSAIFHILIGDMNEATLALASMSRPTEPGHDLLQEVVAVPEPIDLSVDLWSHLLPAQS
jgi:acyl-CoA dehydrogenase